MGITLMPHIPDNPIIRGIENPVQSNGKLHYPKIGSQMSPIPAHNGDNAFPNLSGKAV
jgi:hypothetical protein